MKNEPTAIRRPVPSVGRSGTIAAVQADVTVPVADAPPNPRVLTKVAWRLIPFMVLLYVLAYLDRINVSFAVLQMSADFKFDSAVYGFGAGVFFVGYFLFEVPSNLILQRVGARRWITRIMISWGLIASAMMFVRGRWSFYGLRMLLGLAEAGFFPGMLLYLTYWFPRAYRARTVAMFFTATAIAGVVGSPVSGMLLDWDGALGLRGWQWLFLVEGIPSVVCGVLVLLLLPDRPADARWLEEHEKQQVLTILREDQLAHEAAAPGGRRESLLAALRDPRLWLLSLIYFLLTIGLYGFSIWMPVLLAAVIPGSGTRIGLLAAIPYGVATVAMVLWGRHSDKTGERRFHATGSALVAAVGFATAPMCHSPVTMLAALSVAAAGVWGLVPPFWAMPSSFLAGSAAAGGIAAINSIGNLGGFLGPYLFGLIKRRSATYGPSLWMIATAMTLCAATVLLVRDRAPRAEDVR